jgi:hypothetical protein
MKWLQSMFVRSSSARRDRLAVYDFDRQEVIWVRQEELPVCRNDKNGRLSDLS